jgi:hypothetical protein
MNALSLGVVSLATEAVCGVQEAQDRLALAVPAFGDWVHGIPSNINVRGLLLEDLAAAAAAHNAGKLQPPSLATAAAMRGGSSSSSSTTASQQQQSCAATATTAGGLVDPLALVGASSSGSSSSSASTAATKQQQQQVSLPPLSAPCLDGMRLLLSAGWMVASDVLLNDGRMVELVLQQPSGGLSNASIQVCVFWGRVPHAQRRTEGVDGVFICLDSRLLCSTSASQQSISRCARAHINQPRLCLCVDGCAAAAVQ